MAGNEGSTDLRLLEMNTGDEIFDLCCTPCSKKKRNKEATKYCLICKEYFCVTCVENHNSFTVLSGHVMMDPNTTQTSAGKSRGKIHAVPTEMCKKHPLKLVDTFCGSHDTVGCSMCFILNHKSCDDIHYIPEFVQSNIPERQVQQINKDLTKAINGMKQLKTHCERLKDNMDKSKDKCKQEIQKYREDIKQILDQLEAASLAELDGEHKDMAQRISSRQHKIDGIHREMVRLKSEMESDQSNESQKFVIAKLSECMMKQCQELQSALPDNRTSTSIPELTFTRNADIMNFLLSFVTLGMLGHPERNIPSLLSTSTTYGGTHQQQIMSTSRSDDTINNKTVSIRQKLTALETRAHKQQDLETPDKSEYNIQQSDDKKSCRIWSSCLLDNGDILLLDNKNNKLKLVDSETYTIKSSLAMVDTTLLSVCTVSGTEAAVCLDNDTIQFVSTCDKLVPTHSLSMNHYCRCMVVIRDEMYVCDKTTVYVYRLNGELVKIISEDKSRKDIFSSIWDITVSDDEKMIHVADLNNGVITLDTDGNVVWRYSGTELRVAYGVCTDGAGNVIVCGADSSSIILLGAEGQYIEDIVFMDDGVLNPLTVTYDKKHQKLIVGKYNNNTLTVFTIQKLAPSEQIM